MVHTTRQATAQLSTRLEEEQVARMSVHCEDMGKISVGDMQGNMQARLEDMVKTENTTLSILESYTG
jgi:hypothetical protein